ncbi:hypothetical protein AMJ52_09790 [candidate division TA06 bacterium DG_78]|uniref:SnoaL-like domain-containing protein n=1 Tax=candidate division TA06 bacterium DG_78 TaxID=1703772 RepID=A0A0S7Y7E1_UNCT6|nr:MAG: hypothetical protein AMJ52_09790 [candidate division TA06 bacterium DG_78]
MKSKFLLLLGFLLLVISACTEAVDIEAETTAIKTVLNNYVISVENEDMELYEENIADDATMVNYGVFGDPIVGPDALIKVIEGQNTTLSGIQIDVNNVAIHVSADGKLAWATCLWNFTAVMAENPIVLPVRCTWVLEKRDTGWLIVHFHKSVPAG